jgi:hypothetical protein
LPPTGWRTAVEPCSECLLIVEFEADKITWPGTYKDCYNCANRLTAVRAEKQEPSFHDRYSNLADYDESVREYRLSALMFAKKSFTPARIERWLTDRELGQFKADGTKGLDWSVFTKNADPEACVLVNLGDGVIGRCILDVTAV